MIPLKCPRETARAVRHVFELWAQAQDGILRLDPKQLRRAGTSYRTELAVADQTLTEFCDLLQPAVEAKLAAATGSHSRGQWSGILSELDQIRSELQRNAEAPL